MFWQILFTLLALQGHQGAEKSTVPLRAHTELTIVNVSVLTIDGRFVTGLQARNFRIFEDKVEQEILYFSSEDVPISVGVILDNSGSMQSKAAPSREAVLEFFKTSNPLDEFFTISFSERAEVLGDFTSRAEDLQLDLALAPPANGRTALLDAVYLGLNKLQGARYAKKALIIISDGGDNHSRYSERDVKHVAKECDCQIYVIGVFDPVGFRRTEEELWGPELLYELTEMTGGRGWAVQNSKDISDVARAISKTLREEYTIAYRSSNRQHDGRWRKIKVKMTDIPRKIPPLDVKFRAGYYAPSN